jgi:GT2 family glycosyltransferase
MAAPLVSVVMAVHNERPYLEVAIQSVLDQTFKDFEFIIVNDGSTDDSEEVLDRFEQSDDRIRLVHQENRGLIASLNRGLDMAQGKYIARMDGDDISHPERFEHQAAFLEENPEIGVLGTQVDKIDANGNVRERWNRSLPTDPDVAAWRLLFNICFCHPTVMMRHALLERLGGYAEWAIGAEDYELFTRALLETRLVNLPETLFEHRRHEDAVSVRKREKYTHRCTEAAASLHRAILGPDANGQIAGFLVWMERAGLEAAITETDIEDFSRVHEYLCALYEACAQQFFVSGSNIRVLRQVLRKLDTIADEIMKAEGVSEGAFHKIRSWSILSGREFLPVVWQVLQSRLTL